MAAVALLLCIQGVILWLISMTVVDNKRTLLDIARTTRVLNITASHIRERLNQMPSLQDLDQAVASAKAAVDAAAQRVIDAQGNAVPQEAIDNVNAIKADADAISPA